jgi:ABC-type transport system involved in cytochrome bd biosynthesis fused ATPase/permease subunit
MHVKPNNFLNRLLPFLGIGIVLVVIIIALLFLSSLFVIGALVGLVLFIIAYVKKRFFSAKKSNLVRKSKTYEHDDQ